MQINVLAFSPGKIRSRCMRTDSVFQPISPLNQWTQYTQTPFTNFWILWVVECFLFSFIKTSAFHGFVVAVCLHCSVSEVHLTCHHLAAVLCHLWKSPQVPLKNIQFYVLSRQETIFQAFFNHQQPIFNHLGVLVNSALKAVNRLCIMLKQRRNSRFKGALVELLCWKPRTHFSRQATICLHMANEKVINTCKLLQSVA